VTVTRVDQGMAAAAARALQSVTVNRELRTRYRQLRVMLHSAGLAATYAFIASKAGPDDGDGEPAGLAGAYRAAAAGIRARLADTGLLPDAKDITVRDVMRELGDMDPVRYAQASAEAAAFAGWLSRLADAVWQEGDGGA
jgi:CRISPR type III-B/RAMP module-associated protein Cmr5